MQFARITVDPDQMNGLPCLRGLRMPVATVVGMVADGMTAVEIAAIHPDLEPEDVREALAYAAEASASASYRCWAPDEVPGRQPAVAAGPPPRDAGHDPGLHVRDCTAVLTASPAIRPGSTGNTPVGNRSCRPCLTFR